MWTRIVYFSRETMVSLRRNVLMTVAGIATVAVSLALFGGILMLSKWVDHGTERIKGGVTLEIFMKVDAPKDADRRGRSRARGRCRTSRATCTSTSRGRSRSSSGSSAGTPTSRATSPPPTFPSRSASRRNVRSSPRSCAGSSTTQPGVEDVTTPGEALKGLIDVTNTVRLIFIVISLVLLGSSLFLIVNTIRLATFARRREIEVMKLVGASNWFVRIPFIAEGMVQGIVGAGLAVVAVLALKRFGFDQAFADPNSFFGDFFVTTGDATLIAFVVLLIGVLIGMIGAIRRPPALPPDLTAALG